LANQSGIFKGPIRYRIEGTGDLKSWTAFATVASTGDVIEMTVSMTMVKAEKWDSNPKWKTMPDVMGRYRSAMFLIRTHCPEVIMGLPSREELEDFEGVSRRAETWRSQGSAASRSGRYVDAVG
jgi:hypothetical protein